MAVIVLKHAEKYAGTHAERLAMDVSRVSLGSTFFEWDTSELFTFSPTGWVDKIGQVAGSMQLSGSNVPLSGQKNVTTAGTRVPLGTTQKYKEINIIAKDTNTGYIYVGNSTVDSTNGAILPKGGYVTLQFIDIADVYIDSSVNGEGVSWIGVI